MRDEILKESENREANIERLREHREVDIPRLNDSIKILTHEREEMEQALLKQTGEEFDKIRELMSEE